MKEWSYTSSSSICPRGLHSNYFSSYPRLDLRSVLFHSGFRTTFFAFLSPTLATCLPISPHCHYLNSIWWRVHIMKLPIIHFSQSYCHLCLITLACHRIYSSSNLLRPYLLDNSQWHAWPQPADKPGLLHQVDMTSRPMAYRVVRQIRSVSEKLEYV